MVKLRQFLLLTWKNFKLQSRHPWATLLELGIPALFSICLVFIRSIVSSEYVSEPVVYKPFSIDSLPQNLTPKSYGNTKWQILYVPDRGVAPKVMNDVEKKLGVISVGFDTEDRLMRYFKNDSSYVLSGVIFDSKFENFSSSKNISYTIRPKSAEGGNTAFNNTLSTWFTQFTFPMFPALGPRNKELGWGGSPGYMSQGFLPVQHAVAMSIIKHLKLDFNQNINDKENLDVQMCRYPYPPFLDDKFIVALQIFLPMIICFSFIYPSVNIVKNIVIEKEKRLKEAMKMMGLSKWLHWMAWFFKYFIFLLISCGIVTLLLCTKFHNKLAVINSSDPSVIFCWLILYTSSMISFCFLVSTIFSGANSAAAGSGVIFFVTFLPYYAILSHYSQMSHSLKLASCLLPNLAVSIGSIVLSMSEASGSGLQWALLEDPSTPDDNLTMSLIFLMFFLDSIIFLVLTWYVEAVFPGEYGVPEPWYFPFTRQYWWGNMSTSNAVDFLNSEVKHSEFFEREPEGLLTGIQIQGLTKVFGKDNQPAVNNANINMYRSHVTVLLGHNGAGKTTTISMLTGLITPSSGTATVNGYDICEDIDSVHSSLGICPQHDVLFNELTVKEHLYFFCKLKGYISDLVPSEIDRIINILKLEGKRNAQAGTLSGGWKRKLSVAIALVGGSRIVILDEPTSGMDPFNRRSLWDVLQAEKEDRTILLTTHFMEEADVLGDRIAIMSKGEIQCCGSPLFLKKKYGAGYHLVMVKEPSCDVPLITEIIQSHVPDAVIASNIGSELKYTLPHESSYLFHGLFSELEKRKEELKISGYGASITTMEEVFIKVGNQIPVDEDVEVTICKESVSPIDSGIHVNTEYNDDFSGTDVDLNSIDYYDERGNTGIYLFFQQFYALLEKRILHSYRNFLLTSSQLVLQPFFLILTLLMMKTMPKFQYSPLLQLRIDSYRGTDIPYIVNLESNRSQVLGDIFASQFTGLNKPILLDSKKYNLTDYLLERGQLNIGKYNKHNMIAADFASGEEVNGTVITSLFNNQGYHSPAIALLATDNIILKYLVNESYSFSVSNYPLPLTVADQGYQLQTQATEPSQISQSIIFGMSFLIASFAIFIIKERASNSKHLQRVSGVNLFSYWLASFVWDFLSYLIPCCLVLLVFVCFKTEGLSSPVELGRLFLLFLIHGFSALPFVYCCTFLFYSPSTAFVRLSLINILTGFACLLTVQILEIPQFRAQYISKPLDSTFSILLPNYALGRAVYNLYQNHQFNKLCNNELVEYFCSIYHSSLSDARFDIVKPCCKGKCGDACTPWEENYLSITSAGIGMQLIFLAVQCIVFTFLLVLCERNFFRYLHYEFKKHKISPTQILSMEENLSNQGIIEDDDVQTERLKIVNSPLTDLFLTNHLVVKQLTKQYGSLLAVNQVTFSVQKGECFGLLGLNGAGKTTAFKMITGDESITSGEVYLDGYSIKNDTRKVQNRIGYCPQFNALIDQLTGYETLTLYSRLRGIPEYLISNQITSLAELLGFESQMRKQVKYYSGGNKRKLSAAIALVGNPPVIFLDEPTTGMDPVARRHMWKALLQVLQSGCSIVLTSHSMDECEALCSRLVIMVNGKLCCLGSPQHLKSKFGQGFTLIIKVGRRPAAKYCQMTSTLHPTEDMAHNSTFSWLSAGNPLFQDIEDVKAFVERTFNSATLKSAHENLLHYHIPNPQLNWSEIFKAMEEAKMTLNIEDYSVGETTLEQVFLTFASIQRHANTS